MLKLILIKVKNVIKELGKGITIKDVVLLSILPTVTLMIMFLPMNIQNSMKLNLTNPMYWQYFTSAFVHLDIGHYLRNLVGYVLFVPPLFLLLNKVDKRYFFIFLLLVTILLPIIGSVIVIKLYPTFWHEFTKKIKYTEGASGIVSSIIGGSLLLIICYLSKKHYTKRIIKFKLLLFILFYELFTFLLIYCKFQVFIISTTIILLILFLVNYKEILIFAENTKKEFPRASFFLIFFVVMLFILAPPISLYPIHLSVEVNTPIHLIGLMLGSIIGFVMEYIKLK